MKKNKSLEDYLTENWSTELPNTLIIEDDNFCWKRRKNEKEN